MTTSIPLPDNHKTPTLAPPSRLTPLTKPTPPVEDWSSDTQDLVDSLPRAWTSALLYLLLAFAATVLPWSMLTTIEETGQARGKLEPQGNTIKLDAPVVGKIATINVKEGETVQKGQVLLSLDTELLRNEMQEISQGLEGQINRLAQLKIMENQLILAVRTQELENQAQALEKQAQIAQAQGQWQALQATYNLEIAEKKAQVGQEKQTVQVYRANHRLAQVRLEAATEKVPRYQLAFAEGVVPQERLEEVIQAQKESQEQLAKAVLEIEQALSRLQERESSYAKMVQQSGAEIEQALLRLQEQRGSYNTLVYRGKLALLKSEQQLKNIATEITTLTAEIAAAQTKIDSLKLQIKQRVFRSPVAGILFQLPAPEPGKVVQPGELIAQIAPQGTPLILKAQMLPTETGLMQVGMPVKVKFDAYPFQDYGVSEGRLHWASPDSKVEQTPQGKVESFAVEIVLNKPYVQEGEKRINLKPGQTAIAEIIVRERRVIDFVLDPFKKLQKTGIEL